MNKRKSTLSKQKSKEKIAGKEKHQTKAKNVEN